MEKIFNGSWIILMIASHVRCARIFTHDKRAARCTFRVCMSVGKKYGAQWVTDSEHYLAKKCNGKQKNWTYVYTDHSFNGIFEWNNVYCMIFFNIITFSQWLSATILKKFYYGVFFSLLNRLMNVFQIICFITRIHINIRN